MFSNDLLLININIHSLDSHSISVLSPNDSFHLSVRFHLAAPIFSTLIQFGPAHCYLALSQGALSPLNPLIPSIPLIQMINWQWDPIQDPIEYHTPT